MNKRISISETKIFPLNEWLRETPSRNVTGLVFDVQGGHAHKQDLTHME